MSERKGVVPIEPMRVRTVNRDGVGIYEAECPNCKTWGEVDDDQWNGRVSILCDCGFHETIDLRQKFVAFFEGTVTAEPPRRTRMDR